MSIDASRSDRPTDAATRTVLGVPELLEGLAPDSEAGSALVSALEWHPPGAESAWRDEIRALRDLEAWAESSPEALDDLRDHLAELPRLRAVLECLRNEDVLGEGHLFDLKQFCFYGELALEAISEVAEDVGASTRWAPQLGDLLTTIHPGGENVPRFHLAAELDDSLADALDERRTLERRLRRERDALESEIIDEFGGSFDLRGRYRPTDSTSKETLLDDPRLTAGPEGLRAHSDGLDQLREDLAEARDRADEHEVRVRSELTATLQEACNDLAKIEGFLAILDLRLAKIRLKRRLKGCWGTWATNEDGPVLSVTEGREPRIRRRTAREGDDIQPIDFDLGPRPRVVTGPNMGGKSALLALVGLCQWCAQHALPIPATTFQFAPVEAIVYVGSEEPNAVDASRGLSSFGREVRRFVESVDRTDPPTLWLLDELGRGTHPEDGAEMALECIERLEERGDLVAATTHFPTLAAAPSIEHSQIRGIVERRRLQEALGRADTLPEIESALRAAMDFQPESTEESEVPKDARLVARALGMELDEE